MKKLHTWAVFISVLGFFSLSLFGQAPSQPGHVGTDEIQAPANIIRILSNYYMMGKWDLLQKEIDDLFKDKLIEGNKIDAKKNFYFIVFLSSQKGEESRLIRIPWQFPHPDPYITRIPGEKEIYEILLDIPSKLTIKTSYTSTATKNPLLDQIPKFIKTIEPSIYAMLTSIAKAQAPANLAPSKLNVELRSVSLPFKRAKISIKDEVFLNQTTAFSAVTEFADSIDYRIARWNKDGPKLVKSIKDNLNELLKKKDEDKPLSDRMSEAVQKAYVEFINTENPRGEDLELAVDIEKAFLDKIGKVVAAQEEAECEFANVPLENVSFGLISSFFIANDFTGRRVKVTDDGFYAADPPSNPLTAAIVNIHLKYDPQSAKMSAAEILGLFAGIVLTPDAGLCAGAAVFPLRGISLNAGVAFMGSHIMRDPIAEVVEGKNMNKPGDPDKPFITKWDHVFFLGLGYSF